MISLGPRLRLQPASELLLNECRHSCRRRQRHPHGRGRGQIVSRSGRTSGRRAPGSGLMTRSASGKLFSSFAGDAEGPLQAGGKYHFQKPSSHRHRRHRRQDSVGTVWKRFHLRLNRGDSGLRRGPARTGSLIAATVRAADESGAGGGGAAGDGHGQGSADGRFIQRTLDRSRLWSVQSRRRSALRSSPALAEVAPSRMVFHRRHGGLRVDWPAGPAGVQRGAQSEGHGAGRLAVH